MATDLSLPVTKFTGDLMGCLRLLSQENHRAQAQHQHRSSARIRAYESPQLQHLPASGQVL